jgi:hypothetical protein
MVRVYFEKGMPIQRRQTPAAMPQREHGEALAWGKISGSP